MDRLSIYLTLMTGAVLTGSLVTTVFVLGYMGWVPILIAVAIGWLLSWPAAYLVSRRIKRDDPNWDETRINRADRVPRPSDPKV